MENLKLGNLVDTLLEETINLAIQGKGEHLHAIVRDEDVFLSGEVTQKETKRDIACLVEKMPGIRMITNHIRLKLPDESLIVNHF